MKNLLLIFLFSLISINVFGQAEAITFKEKQLRDKDLGAAELKESLVKYDFSKLLTHTDNSMVYGFIGDNYQRIRIKIITIIKDNSLPDTYHVYGKSMVKNNVDEFNGIIKISNIRKFSHRLHGCEDGDKFKGYKGEFVLLGDYDFQENKNQAHAGTFKGTLSSDFFISNMNKICYNNIEDCSDGFTNNQFVGNWVAYKDNTTKRCNWGDFRIPNSGDFDIGAGDFSPGDKYLKYGWQSVRDLGARGIHSQEAKAAENAKWWK